MGVTKRKKWKLKELRAHRQVLRLLLCGCVIVTLLVVGISLLFYRVYERTLTEEMITYSAQGLDSTDTMISEVFRQIENIGYQQALATARLVNSSDRDIVYDYYRLQQLTDGLVNMKNSHNYIHSCYIYFNQGSVIATSLMGVTSARLFYDTDWLDIYRANANQVVWINGRKPYSAQYEGNLQLFEKYLEDTSDVFTLLVPLSSSMRNRGGVVVINVYESEIAKLLNRSADDREMEMLMADAQGQIVAAADVQALYTDLPQDVFSQLQSGGRAGGHFGYTGTDGERLICVYTGSRFNQNYLLQMIPISRMLAPTSGLLRDIMLCAAAFLILSLGMVLALMYLSYRPVRQLYRELGKNLSGMGEDSSTAEIQSTISKMIQDNRALTKLWENNRMLIKHRTLSLMLQGRLKAGDMDGKRLESLDIRFPYPYFTCCVLHLGTAQHAPVILDEQYEVTKMQLFPLLQRCLTPPAAGYTVDLDDLNIAVIINLEQNDPALPLGLCQRLQEVLTDSDIVPYTVSIGLGTCIGPLDSLSLAFRQACSAMRYALASCPGEIVNFSSICIAPAEMGWGSIPEETELLEAIRIGDFTAASRHLSDWFAWLLRAGATLETLKQAATGQMGQIINLLPEIGLAINSSASTVTADILQAEQQEQIKQLLLDFITDICTQIQSRREHKNSEIMETILQYMRSNYQKEISLNQVAENVYMSVPYLCKIFKEYTNQTFTDYLTTLRIEASMELLRTSNKKIMDIAASVGYANVQSYIRAFKKVNNMTPTDFRDSLISDKLQK